MSTVCLAMIVKNESRIISRCLAAALPFVDEIYIIDTGSIDNTQDQIIGWLDEHEDDVSRWEVSETPWVDFSYNRNHLVKQACSWTTCDYLLLLDADMIVDGDPQALANLTAPGYMIELPGPLSYRMLYLIRADTSFTYHGRTHEFLGCDDPDAGPMVNLENFTIDHRGDGGTRPEKWTRDLALLEEDFLSDPDSQRTCFYLAQTCKDLGKKDRALELYRRRAKLGGWDEEVFWSLFQIAELTGDTDDYLQAWSFRPHRLEPIHRLLQKFNERGMYQVSRNLRTLAWDQAAAHNDILFVERWVETYGFNFEFAVCLWWTGSQFTAADMFRELLQQDDLPDNYRRACEHNLTFC